MRWLEGNGAKRITTIGTRNFKSLSVLVRLVRVRRLGEKVWSLATCVDFAGPRSFLAKTGDVVYRRRRNRRDLLSTGETTVTDQSDLPVTA